MEKSIFLINVMKHFLEYQKYFYLIDISIESTLKNSGSQTFFGARITKNVTMLHEAQNIKLCWSLRITLANLANH